MMKIGVFGGTFDPVHHAHLAVAEEARTQLKLAEVVFVPAGQPWLKSGRQITAPEHRLEMLRLALAERPHFKLSATEIGRAGPSYTVDTIEELRGRLEKTVELYFIFGWDSLAALPLWRDASRLIRLCRLVAAPRPGYPRPDLKTLEARLPGVSLRLTILDKPRCDISATDIRQRVAQGLDISRLVPAAVAEYIKRNGLYTQDAPQNAPD